MIFGKHLKDVIQRNTQLTIDQEHAVKLKENHDYSPVGHVVMNVKIPLIIALIVMPLIFRFRMN